MIYFACYVMLGCVWKVFRGSLIRVKSKNILKLNKLKIIKLNTLICGYVTAQGVWLRCTMGVPMLHNGCGVAIRNKFKMIVTN